MIFWIALIIINGLLLGYVIDRYHNGNLPIYALVPACIGAMFVIILSITSIYNGVGMGG